MHRVSTTGDIVIWAFEICSIPKTRNSKKKHFVKLFFIRGVFAGLYMFYFVGANVSFLKKVFDIKQHRVLGFEKGEMAKSNALLLR
jgi:hypothetical protein